VFKIAHNRSEKLLTNNNFKEDFLITDSLNLHYWKGGSGPVVLFIHGFAQDAAADWPKEMVAFSKNYTVIAADLVWFGKSDSKKPTNLYTQTQALVSLLKNLKVDSLSIIGQSYGGFVAVDLALTNEFKVQKLIIANSPGPTFVVNELQKLCVRYNVKNVNDILIAKKPDDIQLLANMSVYKDKELSKFIRKQYFSYYAGKNTQQMNDLLNSLPSEKNRISNIEPLKKIKTLVLWGKEDELFPEKEGEKFAKAINAFFISVPNTGHAMQLDDEEQFIQILSDFISDKKPNTFKGK